VSGQPGYRRGNGSLIPLNGGNVPMHELTSIIRRLEEIRGEQLIVELETPAAEHTQRLYASLGVLVRFVQPRTEE
jgi:hypothetical protein